MLGLASLKRSGATAAGPTTMICRSFRGRFQSALFHIACQPAMRSRQDAVVSIMKCMMTAQMTDLAHQRRQRLTGIALMCGAVALFACLDTTAKYLNTQMDSLEIAWARYTSAFVLTLIVSNPLTHTGSAAHQAAEAADHALGPAGRLDRAEFPGAALAAARRGAVDHLHLSVHRRHRLRPAAGRMDRLAALGRDLLSALAACC